jgi:hypothetical protein
MEQGATNHFVHIDCDQEKILIAERLVVMASGDKVFWEVQSGSARVVLDHGPAPFTFQGGDTATPGSPAVASMDVRGIFAYHMQVRCQPGGEEKPSPAAVMIVE